MYHQLTFALQLKLLAGCTVNKPDIFSAGQMEKLCGTGVASNNYKWIALFGDPSFWEFKQWRQNFREMFAWALDPVFTPQANRFSHSCLWSLWIVRAYGRWNVHFGSGKLEKHNFFGWYIKSADQKYSSFWIWLNNWDLIEIFCNGL